LNISGWVAHLCWVEFEENLDDAIYNPEQLAEMKLQQSEKEPLIVPGKRSLLVVLINELWIISLKRMSRKKGAVTNH